MKKVFDFNSQLFNHNMNDDKIKINKTPFSNQKQNSFLNRKENKTQFLAKRKSYS